MAKCPAWREGNFGSCDRCYATKEMEACECLGNEAFCDFYPEERKAATQPKYGEWISVKDRLPEAEWEDNQRWCSVMVLATTRGSVLYGYFYVRKDNGTWEFVSYDEDMDFDRCVTITHWMPLPKPPKEDTP